MPSTITGSGIDYAMGNQYAGLQLDTKMKHITSRGAK